MADYDWHYRRLLDPPSADVTQEEWDALFEWARRVRDQARVARARGEAIRAEWRVAPGEMPRPPRSPHTL